MFSILDNILYVKKFLSILIRYQISIGEVYKITIQIIKLNYNGYIHVLNPKFWNAIYVAIFNIF